MGWRQCIETRLPCHTCISDLKRRLLLSSSSLLFYIKSVNSSAKVTASQLNMPDKSRKRQNEAIKRKKKTATKNIHKFRKLPNINKTFIIHQNKQYITY
jgi:hypothetical protein